MNQTNDKFSKLGVENAPGQELNLLDKKTNNDSRIYQGKIVDFSHGDVDAFNPIPNSLEEFIKGVKSGADQAYTEYKGKASIREYLATKISMFTGCPISQQNQLIITPGSQGALFLAMASIIEKGDKVTIVTPDYFANRKIAQFFDAEIINIELEYLDNEDKSGINLLQLEESFKSGAKLFVFSNPNNPTGVIYSDVEISSIVELASKYCVTVIVDQLYSRQVFDDRSYTHICAKKTISSNLITIMGPSKTESLSGFRLGVAFGSEKIIARMEKLQALVSLRASGYNQAVLNVWFNEPKGWIEERIKQHQNIRDQLINLFTQVHGVRVRTTEA